MIVCIRKPNWHELGFLVNDFCKIKKRVFRIASIMLILEKINIIKYSKLDHRCFYLCNETL